MIILTLSIRSIYTLSIYTLQGIRQLGDNRVDSALSSALIINVYCDYNVYSLYMYLYMRIIY